MEEKLTRGALKSILTAINALEGLDMGELVEDARSLLMKLKNEMAANKAFQGNGTLRRLDAVFKAAGWDDQGLRWCVEEDSDHGVPEIWVVHFTDKYHDTWEIA